MLIRKTFDEIIIKNSKKDVSTLYDNIYQSCPEISTLLGNYLLIAGLIPYYNKIILVISWSIIEHLLERFKDSLEPKEN